MYTHNLIKSLTKLVFSLKEIWFFDLVNMRVYHKLICLISQTNKHLYVVRLIKNLYYKTGISMQPVKIYGYRYS